MRDEDIPRTVDYSGYQFPGIDLLADPTGNFSAEMDSFVREQATKLTAALREFDIEGEIKQIDSGPVITTYQVELAEGTRAARLQRHGKQCRRLNLTRSKQRILFARTRQCTTCYRRCQRQQIVGGVTHCRDHGNNVKSGGAIARNARNDGGYALNGADRTPAVLLNEQL